MSETLDSTDSMDARRMDMIYTIEDTPPWYLCVFLGLQVNPHVGLDHLKKHHLRMSFIRRVCHILYYVRHVTPM